MAHSVTITSGALTAVTESAVSTVPIAGKKGELYTVKKITARSVGTLETGVVGAGGLVRLDNDGMSWEPLKFYTGFPAAITATSSGFVESKKTELKVNLPLPAGSNIKAYFTPYDNQSQKFQVEIFYEKRPFTGKQTRMESGKGTAVTAATKASDHVSITIPSAKGGRAYAILAIGVGITEIAGTAPYAPPGGKVELKNKSADPSWEPTEFFVDGVEALVAGGARVDPVIIPVDLDLPENSTVLADFTPNDDLSVYLALTVIYE
jgi:hypothetical protein